MPPSEIGMAAIENCLPAVGSNPTATHRKPTGRVGYVPGLPEGIGIPSNDNRLPAVGSNPSEVIIMPARCRKSVWRLSRIPCPPSDGIRPIVEQIGHAATRGKPTGRVGCLCRRGISSHGNKRDTPKRGVSRNCEFVSGQSSEYIAQTVLLSGNAKPAFPD